LRDKYNITFSNLAGDFAAYNGTPYVVNYSPEITDCTWMWMRPGMGENYITLEWGLDALWKITLQHKSFCSLGFQFGNETEACAPRTGSYTVNLTYSMCDGCTDTNSCTNSAASGFATITDG